MKNPESILVVNDNPLLLIELKKELKDYDITDVLSAEQAMAVLKTTDFCAIISSSQISGISGIDLIRQCVVRYPDMVRIIILDSDNNKVSGTEYDKLRAYQLVKPWGNYLRIILHNAVNQRERYLNLQDNLNLSKEFLDFDRILHAGLETSELVENAAFYISRLPEVLAVEIYFFNEDKTVKNSKKILESPEIEMPAFRQTKSIPMLYRDNYLYSVPIGTKDNMSAAITVIVTNDKSDLIKYFDFAGRMAGRAIKFNDIKKRNTQKLVPVHKNEESFTVNAEDLIDFFTTPATVVSSWAENLGNILKEFESGKTDKKLTDNIASQLKEMHSDLSKVGNKLTDYLSELRDNIESKK